MSGGIAARQAKVLIERMIGQTLTYYRVNRALRKMAAERRISGGWVDRDELTPDDVDRLAGELWRERAAWYQKRNVKGDFESWVLLARGEWRLLRLAYRRAWDKESKAERAWMPDRVDMWVWPTAAVCGRLVRIQDREGYPAYVDETLLSTENVEPWTGGDIPIEISDTDDEA